MFVLHYTHPLFEARERERLRDRWTDAKTGQKTASYDKVLAGIRDGAGSDFLNIQFYDGQLPDLDNDRDLRGIQLSGVDKDFGPGDTFKGLDFRYAEFWHCHLKNAVFYSCSLDFARFYNCTFENCAFAFTSFLAVRMEKCRFVDCDLPEACSLENVMAVNSTFDRCFFGPTTPFRDCYFDDLSAVTNLQLHSYHYGANVTTSLAALSGFFSSFQAAYEAAGVEELASKCFWEGRQAYTRHNTRGVAKVFSLLNELLSGYGTRPRRPLLAMVALYATGTAGYAQSMPLNESIVFTAGALFTFGAASEHLRGLGWIGRLYYVVLAFSGIALSALFVTSLAHRWFRPRIPAQTVQAR